MGDKGNRDSEAAIGFWKRPYVFVIGRYSEDFKQGPKFAPDLVESIMRPTDPVKEELRMVLMTMGQFGPRITKIRVSSFWIPEI